MKRLSPLAALRSRLQRFQRGQAMSEYLIASAVVLGLLTIAGHGEHSAIAQLLDAFRLAFARFSHFISLPL